MGKDGKFPSGKNEDDALAHVLSRIQVHANLDQEEDDDDDEEEEDNSSQEFSTPYMPCFLLYSPYGRKWGLMSWCFEKYTPEKYPRYKKRPKVVFYRGGVFEVGSLFEFLIAIVPRLLRLGDFCDRYKDQPKYDHPCRWMGSATPTSCFFIDKISAFRTSTIERHHLPTARMLIIDQISSTALCLSTSKHFGIHQ